MAGSELPRRFYKEAGVAERDGGYALTLDGRMARTPGKALIEVPSRALADGLAAEWNGQGERIDPAAMPLTRIVNSTIDGVAKEAHAVADEIVRYAGSDLLCYRAETPETLVARQVEAWDPILGWLASELGSPLNHAEGIRYTEQPPESLAAIRAEVEKYDPFRLAALHVITTLTGSAVLALAVARGRLEPEAAWSAGHLDEDFQIEKWGNDEIAQLRRAARWRDMDAAARILAWMR
jgi:chaperone required for assembly of F1-ATPase